MKMRPLDCQHPLDRLILPGSGPPRGVSIQDRLNYDVYSSKDVERSYRSTVLIPPEASALLKYQSCFAGKNVLDIGVGTGRTTHYLAPLAARYTCIDYSARMIGHMRQHFPGVEALQADMRNLSPFADASFDFVLAPNNVMDAVSHVDRLTVLGEVHRVLRPNGIFIFSSHNRDYAKASAGPQLEFSRNPVTQLMNLAIFVRQLANHWRTGKLRRTESEYSLLDDGGHDYTLLHYYVDEAHQELQLNGAGFEMLDVFAYSGFVKAREEKDVKSPSLHYVARKR